MKPIGRTRKIPYCDHCADKLLIPSLDIAKFGVYFEDLADNLKLAVSDYYAAKGCTTKYFNAIVDELEAEWNNMVDQYYEDNDEDLKLMEEALLFNG
jgi:hypothetical protein